MKKSKQAKQLPNRAAMNTIAKSGRTINDYAKASPMTGATPAVMMQNWRGTVPRGR